MTVYADNAATTQMSENVLKAMMPLLTDIYGNPSSLHSIGQVAKEYLENARETVADCIGADPKEIYFTSGGSEADNQAIRSAAYIGARKGKKHIISSKFEHHAVLHTLDALKKEGFTVTLLDVYSNGVVKPEDVENAITDETCLVTIMTANNEIGTIQPIAEIGKICKEKGVLFHTDAVQAVGHIPIDVNELCVDMLSASAHKFNGPKGVGFLYVRKGTLLSPYVDGGAQEYGMRAGTENVASIVGMATALKKSCDEMQQTTAKLRMMENIFIDTLSQANVDFIRNGAVNRVPGNINISIRNASGEVLLHRLDLKGISVSTGSACDSVNTKVSHVIQAIGVPQEYAKGTIRVSFGRDNELKDAVEVAKAVADVLQR